MQCIQCEESIGKDSKTLDCVECSGVFHLACLPSITEQDYSFLTSARISWKCDSCVKNKPLKCDETDSDSSNAAAAPRKVACFSCCKGFSRNAHRAKCVKCGNVFHFKHECLSLSKEEYFKVQASWVCHVCDGNQISGRKVQAPVAMTFGLATDKAATVDMSVCKSKDALSNVDKITEEVTLGAVLKEMMAFRTEVNKTHKNLEENMNRYSEWVIDQGKKIDEVTKKLTDLCADVANIHQENINLKKQVSDLTSKLESLEQAGKENTIEIYGVPRVDQENVLETVNKIATAIGFEFNSNMIDNCYRYKTNDSRQPGGIVVKFVRKLDLQSFVEKRRAKRNLNTRDVGVMTGEASPIYVNFSLTKEKKNLMKEARKVKQEKHYTYLWVNNGHIFMRKEQGAKPVLIQSVADLGKLQ